MEATDVNKRRGRITGSILAVLAATVVACGSIQGSAGKADPQRQGGGANYLTADDSYGVGLAHIADSTVPAEARTDGYCPNGWCPPVGP